MTFKLCHSDRLTLFRLGENKKRGNLTGIADDGPTGTTRTMSIGSKIGKRGAEADFMNANNFFCNQNEPFLHNNYGLKNGEVKITVCCRQIYYYHLLDWGLTSL